MQKVLIIDPAGYLTEELLSRIPIFTEHHLGSLKKLKHVTIDPSYQILTKQLKEEARSPKD